MNKEQMNYFWKKKGFVYFVLSILVFFIHISAFAQYGKFGGKMAFVNEKMTFFFTESITRFAVPMFFILSGLIFFRDYNNKKYIAKVKSRFFTLVIPFLIWNTVWMLFDIVCSYTAISALFVGRRRFPLTVGNVLKSIFFAEWNIPFWFMLYLIVFVMISPVFDLLVRNKYVGMISVAVLAILSVFEIGHEYSLNYDTIVYYLLGALLGKHYFGAIAKKTSRTSQLISVAFLFVYIVSKNLFPECAYFGLPLAKIVVFILASYSMWSIVDLFMDKISPRSIYGQSFPIFTLHTNVSAVVCKLIFMILPKNASFAFPNFLLTVVLTLVIINVACNIFERYLPGTYGLLMGKGIKNKVKGD